MPYAVREHPDFSWSHSRDKMFRACQRRYYWNYYGSHRGWERSAGEEARLTYQLKQLTTLPLVLGSEIHLRASEIALAIREGGPVPSLEVCRARTSACLNQVWRGSQDRQAFRRAPKHHPMLLEKYYGLPISNDQLARVRAKLEQCTLHLCTWPGWDEVRACDRDDIRLVSSIEAVAHHGIRLYGAPDLVYRGADERWNVVDYKTGAHEDGADQLALYALYLRETGDLAGYDGTCVGRVVDLHAGEEQVLDLGPDDLARAERRVRDSTWAMRGLLVQLDTDRNEAQPRERFALPVDSSRCRGCPYYELCEDELKHAQHFGPF